VVTESVSDLQQKWVVKKNFWLGLDGRGDALYRVVDVEGPQDGVLEGVSRSGKFRREECLITPCLKSYTQLEVLSVKLFKKKALQLK
jgi:hypothetical protein